MFSYLLIGYNIYNIYCIPQLFAYYPKFLALIVVFDCQYISWFFCIAGLGSYQQTVEPTSYHFPEGNLYGTKTWSGPVPFLEGLLSLQLFLLMQFLLILFSLLSLLGSWYAKYVGFLVFFLYWCNLFSNVLWGTVSKALERSGIAISTWLPLSCSLRMF